MYSQGHGEPLRLVILGKTGVGKSHVANVILGRHAFESRASANSVTQVCQKLEKTAGRRIEVVDTPGVIDTGRVKRDVANEILHSIFMSRPGPHAFLLVLQVGRFTDEELKAVEALQEIFGPRVKDYTVVVFNRAQELEGQTLESFMQGSAELCGVVQDCGGRCVTIDNNLQNQTQVTNLVWQVDRLVTLNGGNYFSNDVYRESIRASSANVFVARMMANMIIWVRNFFRVLFHQ